MEAVSPQGRGGDPDLTRLRQAVDASGEIIFMTDREGVFTFVNPTFERVYGYSASEVIGRVTPRMLKSGNVPLEHYTALWQRLIQGRTVESAFVNRSKDGRLVEIETTASPIWDETNAIVGFLAIQHDVTARKRADEARRVQRTALATGREQVAATLRKERDLAQRDRDVADVILLALDVEGRITSINRKGCSILEWAEQELLGRNWVETCLPARIRDELRKKFLNLIGGDLSIVESPILSRSGEERLIEWRNTVLLDGAGRVIGTFSSGVDLADRKHAQSRLQSAALNAAANAIVITDRAGLVQWANPAFFDLTGYTGAETVGKNPWELVNSDQHDQALYEDLWETILTGQVWRGEIINRRKDGSLYIEEQAVTPVRNAQGEISHLIAVKQDITERKRAEEETRQQAQLSALGAAVGLSLNETDSLAHALQHCADALLTHLGAAFARIWTFDERDGVLDLQASAGLYTDVDGLHAKVPLGQFTIGRIALDRKAHVTNAAIGDPEVEDQEWARREAMVAFAGHPLVVDERLVGVMTLFARDALSDTVVAALASVADHIALGIERHRSAAALRSAEERMRFALQNADVGIWDMDYTTGVLRWSETMEAHYGLEPGTFSGTFAAFVERIHPDDRESLMETVGTAMKSGADFRVEHRSIWPDGTVRWLSGAGRVHLGEHSEPVRGLGISLDVTPWKKLELELRHAQKLESVGRLASGVAHEINTPMQFVSDSVHFVQDAMSDLVDVVTKYRAVNGLVLADLPARSAADAAIQADQEMDLDYVLANVPAALDRSIEGLNRVTLIVQSMKDFAHPGRTEMAAVDLNRAIQSTLTIAHSEYKHVADLEIDFGDIPLVMCHGGDVNQAFLNIIVNAAHAIGDTIKGTAARGRIVIQTRADGDDVVVRISDSGGGIPEAIRDQVFDPFFTTKDVGEGTGQGLAIARAVIVEKHSGDLSFETEMGRGSTFIIRLPIDVRSRAGVDG